MKKLAVLFMCAAMLASCDFKGGSKDLKAENDSLLMELTQRNAELDDMMGTFNEVQEGFRKINAAESRVDLQRGTITENSASAKQQIASDIEFISKQMEENKAQIAKLEAQLKNSKYNSTQMKKAVEALTAELKAKQQRIEELQTELASKNIRIQELDAAVSDLSAAKESLAAENEAKAKTVAEQAPVSIQLSMVVLPAFLHMPTMDMVFVSLSRRSSSSCMSYTPFPWYSVSF